jgi:hypothetical protein
MKRARASDTAVAIVEGVDEPALAADMMARTRDEVPEYRAMPAESATDAATHARQHARAVLRSLRAGSPPREDELGFVAALAAKRARQLFPLSAMTHAYRVGYRVVWEHLRREAERIDAGLDSVFAVTALAMDYFNTISAVLTTAYLREQHDITVGAARMREDLLDALLSGHRPRDENAAMRLATFGLAPSSSIVVLVIEAVDDDPGGESLRAAADALARALPSVRAPLVAIRPPRVIAILPAPAEPGALASAVRAACHGAALRAGLSVVHEGLDAAALAHEEAERALRHTGSQRPVVALSEVPLFEDLVDHADAGLRRRIPAWARQLVAEDERAGGELLATLRAYLTDELSVGRAAERLEVHPNTVRYRLGRIETLTGRSLRRFEDLVEIVVAVRLIAGR